MSAWSLEQYADILLDFPRFRWIGTALGGGVAPVRDARHARWMRRHTHEHHFREILIGLAGRGKYGFQGKIYPVSPGTVFLFDADESHDSWYPSFDPPCCHLWLCESSVGSQAAIFWTPCEVRQGRFSLSPSTPAVLPAAAVFWKSWNLLRREPQAPVSRARLFASFTTLLLELYEQAMAARPQQAAEERNRRAVVAEIAEVIKRNLGGDLSLEHLSRLAGYSKFHFLRMFQKYQGCSLRDYIQELKLQAGRELLRRGMKVAAASEALGFANPSAFSRFVKRQTGMPPLAYACSGVT